MIKFKYKLLIVCLSLACEGYAAEMTDATAPAGNKLFTQMGFNGLYAYSNFNYNSYTPDSFNTYHGHSNMLTFRSDFQINPQNTAGIFIFGVHTDLTTQLQLPQSSLSATSQKIINTSGFVHLLHQLNPEFYLDLALGYGKNKTDYINQIGQGTAESFTGYARGYSSDWFGTASLIYNKAWDKISVRANATYLYNQVNQDPFTLFYGPDVIPQLANALTNKTSLLLENVELAYAIKDSFTPFINGGLLQVLQYSNSRQVITGTFIGALPTFNLNQDGYNLGAGISMSFGKFIVRVEEKYYQRGDVFRNNVSLLTLRLNVD